MRAAVFPGDSADWRDIPPLAGAAGAAGNDEGIGGRLHAQRMIYEISAAVWDRFGSGGGGFGCVAGHSLGLYAALYAAGVIGREDGLLLIERAHGAMREIAAERPGGMTAVVGLRWDLVEEICRKTSGVFVANINTATQVVISGILDGLEEAEPMIHAAGALNIKRLDIDAPLHSPLMEGMEDLMRDAVGGLTLKRPAIPVVNHTAPELLGGVEGIADVLCGQFTRRVLWRDSVHFMCDRGAKEFIEVGPSDVLSRLVRWIRRDVPALSTSEALRRYEEFAAPGGARAGEEIREDADVQT